VVKTRVDPNYLTEALFEKSAFHWSLHAWARANPDKPLLHIDIHGKCDNAKNAKYEIDLGAQPLQSYFTSENEAQCIVNPVI